MKRSCLVAVPIAVSLCAPVSAAAQSAQALTIEQTVQDAAQAEVQYTLTPCTADAPMPEGTENGCWQTVLSGAAVYRLPAFWTSSPGAWGYTLTAVSEEAYVSPKLVHLTVYQEQAECICVATLENGEKTDLHFTVQIPAQTDAPTEAPPETVSYPAGTPQTDDQTAVRKHFLWMLASAVLSILLTWKAFGRTS